MGSELNVPTPRLPPIPGEQTRKIAEALGVPAPMANAQAFAVLMRNERVFGGLWSLMQSLIQNARLDARFRELIIMRLAWSMGAEYEWAQHWRRGLERGLTREELAGVRNWQAFPGYSEADRAVLAATDETLTVNTITPQTWARCAAALGDEQALIELVVVIGYWRLFGGMLLSLDIPLDAGNESWPPDGIGPTAAARHRPAME